MRQPRVRWRRGLAIALVALGCAEPPRSAPSAPPFAAEDVVAQVRRAFRPEGAGFVARRPTFVARVDAAGVVQVASADGGAALELETVSLGPGRAAPAPDGSLVVVRGAAREVLRQRDGGLEQSWWFADAPPGDLEVVVRAAGQERVAATTGGLHFADRAGGGFRYGAATWIDARGRRTAVPARFAGGAIRMVVPAAVIAASAFPAVLDPIISPELDVGVPIPSPGVGDQEPSAVAWDGESFLVVWGEENDLGRFGGHVYIAGARVAPDGTLLDPVGFVVARGSSFFRDPVVAFAGGVYLVAFTSNNGDVYAVRVAPDGVVLDAPFAIAADFFQYEVHPAVAPGDGAFLVVFAHGDYGARDVWGARVTTGGAVMDPAGIVIASAAGNQHYPAVARLAGQWLVAWQDERGGAGQDVYAARVSDGGAVAEPAGVVVSAGPGDQDTPAVGAAGALGLVAWEDGADIHAARVDAAGVVLDPAALVLSAAPGNKFWPVVAGDGTAFVVAWRSGTAALMTARVAADGSATAPVTVESIAGVEHNEPALAFGGGQYLATWNTVGGGDVYGARIDVAGAAVPPVGLHLSPAGNAQANPAAAFDGASYLVVWEDTRGASPDLYAARVGPLGELLDPDGFLVTNALYSQTAADVAFGDGQHLVVWQDRRTALGDDIYAARVSAAGAVLDPGGRAISTASGDQRAPAVASDGTTFLVAWADRRGGNDDVYAAFVDSAGVVLDPTGRLIAGGAGSQRAPAVAWDPDTSSYLLVWEDDAAGTFDLVAARLDGAGTLGPPFTVSDAANDQVNADVARGDGGLLVIWETGRISYDDHAIEAARIGPGGVELVLTGLSTSTVDAPAVCWDGARYLVAWRRSNEPYDDAWDLDGRWIAADGTLLAPGLFPLSEEPTTEGRHAIAADGAGGALLAYGRFLPAPPNRAVRLRLRTVADTPLADGSACLFGGSCLSGSCVDGVCCGDPCDGACQACSVAAGAAVDGVCETLTTCPDAGIPDGGAGDAAIPADAASADGASADAPLGAADAAVPDPRSLYACDCAVGRRGARPRAAWAILAALGWAAVRRRRRSG